MKLFCLNLFFYFLVLSQANCVEESNLTKQLHKWLSVPSRENLMQAVEHPKEAMDVLQNSKDKYTYGSKLFPLLEAEIAYRVKENEKATELYVQFVKNIEPNGSQKTFSDGCVPFTFYVETSPPAEFSSLSIPLDHYIGSNLIFLGDSLPKEKRLPPFIGLGTETDNLLIRRFISLGEKKLAGKEYLRVSQLHQKSTHIRNKLQFTWDYALFLQGNKQTDEVNKILSACLLHIPQNIHTAGLEFYNNFPPKVLTIDSFIHLAAGLLKTNGVLDELIAELEKADSINHYKTLAMVFANSGQREKSFEMKLKFIEASKFEDRQRLEVVADLHSEHEKYKEAAEYYEQILVIEKASENRSQLDLLYQGNNSVAHKLSSIYLRLNQHEKCLRVMLDALELRKNLNYHEWDKVKKMADSNDLKPIAISWAKKMVAEPSAFSVDHRAQLFAFIEDIDSVAETLRARTEEKWYNNGHWHRYFSENKRLELYKSVLSDLVKKFPKQPVYLHAYLETFGKDADLNYAINFYEEILLGGKRYDSRDRGNLYFTSGYNRADEMAQNLLSLYLLKDREKAFEAFGVCLLDPEHKIHKNQDLTEATSYFMSTASLSTLKNLKARFNIESKNLEFRLQGWDLARPDFPIPSLKVNEQASILTSSNLCSCFVKSSKYLVSGHRWGITVYPDTDDKPYQVPTGMKVYHVAIHGDFAFAATSDRVLKIDLVKRTSKTLKINIKDLNSNDFTHLESSYDKKREEVYSLHVLADDLWIGISGQILKLDIEKNELTTFTSADLKTDHSSDWSIFVSLSNGDLIASYKQNVSRYYNATTETWQEMPPLITVTRDGEIWVKKRVNSRLQYRPAVYDPNNRNVSVAKIRRLPKEPNWGKNVRNITYLGEYDTSLLFSLNQNIYSYRKEFNDLTIIRFKGDHAESAIFNPSLYKGLHNGSLEYGYNSYQASLPDELISGDNKSLLFDGVTYRNFTDSIDRDDMPPHSLVHFNGNSYRVESKLTATDKDGVSNVLSDKALNGSVVYHIEPFEGGAFLCTESGITQTDEKGNILHQFTSVHGLPTSPCLTATSFNGKIYFGFSHDGIVELDGQSFRTLTKMDGLLDTHIHKLSAEPDRLKITYAKHDRNSDTYQYPDSFITKEGKSEYTRTVTSSCSWYDESILPRVPFIGGQKNGEVLIAGRMWEYGSAGVLIRSLESEVKEFIPMLSVDLVENENVKLRIEAKKIVYNQNLTAKQAFDHANPYVALEAMSHSWIREEASAQLLLKLAEHEIPVIRKKAILLLEPGAYSDSLNKLESLLDDVDFAIRAHALNMCATYADEFPIKELRSYIKEIGGPPSKFAESILSRQLSIGPEVIQVLLEHSFGGNGWTNVNERTVKQCKLLAENISKDTKLLDVLLSASHSSSLNHYDARRMIYPIFLNFNKAVLPYLHKKLESNDRTIRANAALACAAIADSSSYEPLIAALDFESGLSKASIVFALGSLKDIRAIPILLKLDKQLKIQTQDRYSVGVSAMNSLNYAASKEINYTTENEFELPALNDKRLVRSQNEYLLTRETIYSALENMPAKLLQEYYRGEVHVEWHYYSRDKAILKLVHGEGEDIQKNIDTLNSALRTNGSEQKEKIIKDVLSKLEKRQ